jgi:hypothetical protein
MGQDARMTRSIDTYIEVGSKRLFAGALDWPGWCRSARDEAGALEALVTYGPRYAAVLVGQPATDRGPEFEPPADLSGLRVVERLVGGSGTDFGVPSRPLSADEADLDASALERQVDILRACWATLDEVAAAAEGVTLRTGPRGGGRDLAKILGHVLEADQAYLGQLGSRPPRGSGSPAHVAAQLEADIETLTARALDRPIPNPRNTKTLWAPRYFVRRAAWHVLDHAWEIEDRAQPVKLA